MTLQRLTLFLSLLWLTCAAAPAAFGQKAKAPAKPTTVQPPFLQQDNSKKWVDSVFATLTPDQRIGQLIMLAAYSNRDRAFEDTLAQQILRYNIGGLVFFQGGPARQAHLTNRYQKIAKVPLLLAMDAEWGIGMRLDSVLKFPFQMTLGAVQSDTLIYEMGVEVARQFKRLGMHVNFAPVVDVNNNANNPVIGFRSFGENKYNVARKAASYMRGMQDNGIMAVAKHFPGHGDTDVDSHLDLPSIYQSARRIDTLELYPFRHLMKQGLGGVMIAHLSIPSLDTTTNLPSSLSKPVITSLLKEKLGFRGLVFSDAMNMKGVTKFFPGGSADAISLMAGMDILEFPENIDSSFAAIKKAVASGLITQQSVDARVKRVLEAKYWAGLNKYTPVKLANLHQDLNNPQAEYLNRRLTENSVTVLQNRNSQIPLQRIDTLRVAALAIGTTQPTPFQQKLAEYMPVQNFFLPANSPIDSLYRLKERLKGYNTIIVGIHNVSTRPATNYGITPETMVFVKELGKRSNVMMSIFGNAYSVSKFQGLDKINTLIMAYQETENTQQVAAQLIFGGSAAKGHMPVTATPAYTLNKGVNTPDGLRFRYTYPEAVGLSSQVLSGIDTLVNQAIKAGALPGAQVLVAKGGNVIYQKSFGYHTYDRAQAVQNTDIYDLASVTKVSSSLAALMKLQSEGKFDFNKRLADYLPEFEGSNKENLVFREMLTHQAKLKSWIPFWKETVKKNGKFKWRTFKADSSARFPSKVAQNLYIHRKYSKKLYKEIRKSPLNPEPGYVYSDLSFYLYPLIVERITGQKFEDYVREEIYKPIGATTLTFTPERYFPKSRIVPTEIDTLFRKQLLHGTVHDEGAAMLGGVSGHAGLFGTANDLAKLMQLYLQKGQYGGTRLISEDVITAYTRCQFCPDNRRALGFDRINAPYIENGNAAKGASPESFGHSGFTGTFTWIDPKHDLVYVFLSNRVYPTRENNKISQMNVRTNVQQVIYDAIEAARKTPVQ
ncbi:serine hydrolase [Pontibacter sp. E15-1]|uniref:glycoside hydrolase family 3 N-terminal domain-containing protein n=1 Tax=Pontibacter sp. E15-1 TaxID=2919918 RepID=UPI001F4FF27A|nr:glycoside hydrolase family 3 N-terminal domain-containing protein [Pontibacter sp. E15-1]MCJ8166105.1 serine hydrolase [Pontibacter sp. E15-1]